MKKKLYRDIKMKSGIVLPKGLDVEIEKLPGDYAVKIISQNGDSYTVSYQAVFKPPSIKQLEKWEFDGYCKSVTGKKVEPDGHDEFGFPSWLLVLGLI